jgi:hypothetical protein
VTAGAKTLVFVEDSSVLVERAPEMHEITESMPVPTTREEQVTSGAACAGAAPAPGHFPPRGSQTGTADPSTDALTAWRHEPATRHLF